MYFVNDQGEGGKHTATPVKGSLLTILSFLLWLHVFISVLLFNKEKNSTAQVNIFSFPPMFLQYFNPSGIHIKIHLFIKFLPEVFFRNLINSVPRKTPTQHRHDTLTSDLKKNDRKTTKSLSK